MSSKSSTDLTWIFAGAALAVGLLVGAFGVHYFTGGGGPDEAEQAPQESGGPPPANVKVGLVEVRTLQHHVPVIGRLEEVRRVTVTAEVEGKVVQMAVDQGTPVVGGKTTLVQIDDVWSKLSLRTAEADLAVAEAEVEQARADLKQLEQLAAAKSAKAKEVEDQQTKVASMEARLNAAATARDRAHVTLKRLTVTAPFDGTVSQKLVEVGQWVDPGDGVVEMISTGQLDAVVDVPERYISALQLGDPIEVAVDSLGAELLGKVMAIRPDGMNATRTFPVKIRLDDPGNALRPGMSAVAYIPVSKQGEFATVPRDAVLQTPNGATVWYAMTPQPQGPGDAPEDAPGGGTPGGSAPPMPMAMSEPVKVLFGIGDRYAVEPLPGASYPALNQGTQVVVEGAERLFPTQPLTILNGEPATKP